ncbi:MAG: tRNA pseudouridine(38-40) synthase TruA [Clostridia bacterium]|nr:tRNA pseudouridine(38-40) synthase TruA [Clostridia bacterium]
MKRLLLTISYDGTDYHGWQIQPNGITVQQVFEDSLQKMLGRKTAVSGCSRTDAGVHAREFCLHLDCEENIPEKAFIAGLNSILPDSIAVKSCVEVSGDFHARFDCKGKTYVYNFYEGLTDPFLSRFALRLDKLPDKNRVNEFCDALIGTHDYIAFSSSGRTVENTVRTVTDCSYCAEGNRGYFSITANGFLYNMVRIAVGTALDIDSGRIGVDCVEKAFSSGNREILGKTVKPQGLVLEKVFY